VWTVVLLILVPSLILGACAKDSSLSIAPVNEEALFWRANYEFMRGRYEEARENLRLFVTQFPDSPLIPEAHLGIARTYFEEEQYEQARVAYEQFLRFHPRHDRMDEALYFIGLTYFRRIERADRDQTAAQQAVVAFRRLVTEVPDTSYREDAKEKITIARRRLAAQEILVGVFYLKRDKFEGARGRFQRVLDLYRGTGLEPKALYYLGEAYDGLGEEQKALEVYQQVLLQYPDSVWAVESGDRLGIKVVQSETSESNSYPEESGGGILGLLKESWEDIKAGLKGSIQSPVE
jgi:outer membrane protein assembly factor BamD